MWHPEFHGADRNWSLGRLSTRQATRKWSPDVGYTALEKVIGSADGFLEERPRNVLATVAQLDFKSWAQAFVRCQEGRRWVNAR